jgi:arsenite methyltransferase
VSGALAERDFAEKMAKAGFTEIEVVTRRPWGVDECALYPLFTNELIGLMRTLIPVEDQWRVANSIVVKARLG